MWVAFRLMTVLPFLDDNVFVVVVVVVVVFVLQVYSVSTKKKCCQGRFLLFLLRRAYLVMFRETLIS